MEKFGRSQPVKRVEDVRFLTGHGRYVDDIAPEGALFGHVARSQVAHGRIVSIDVEEARAAPGVRLVLTADDLVAAGVTLGMQADVQTSRDGTKGANPERPVLATDRVRYVGEAIAFVVADTHEQAKDAAEMVMAEIEELPAHVGLVTGGEALHDAAPQNLAFDWAMGDEDAARAAIGTAAHVVTLEVPDNRVIVNSLEPRGYYAEIEDGRLHVCVNGQGVWAQKADLVHHLNLDATEVKVTTPDVGGGFGMKGFSYPEMVLVAQATRMLAAPVRWMSDRSEAMQSDNGGRDLTSTAVLAFDADHRLVAYTLDSVANMGAYNSQFGQLIQTDLFAKVMPGTYDNGTVFLRTRGVFTNTNPVDAYRGAGRPEAIFVLERAMDYAAREMGVDPWELRRINFIKADQFPYESATGVTYDVGDFARVLDRAGREADVAGWPARRAASEAKGRLRGQGLCYYIESILGDPAETTAVVFGADGVEVHVGTQSNGQGHETVYAQFLADQTGMPADAITVRQGDSDLIPKGGGTGGSRSVTVQNASVLKTVEQIVTAFGAFLAEDQGVDAGAVSFDDERFRIEGSNLSPTMLEVAEMARGAGREDLMRHSARNKLEGRSFPNGAHVAEIEIDPETGVVTVERYTVVDDLGNLINPMLAEGQVHGGVAQGIGQALMERTVHDEDGQLLTASYMDYAMPRTTSMPWVTFHSEPVPSVLNPMGMKGCGEAGTVGALAAITNAVQDAVWDMGLREMEMPFTPHRVWAMLQQARGAVAAE